MLSLISASRAPLINMSPRSWPSPQTNSRTARGSIEVISYEITSCKCLSQQLLSNTSFPCAPPEAEGNLSDKESAYHRAAAAITNHDCLSVLRNGDCELRSSQLFTEPVRGKRRCWKKSTKSGIPLDRRPGPSEEGQQWQRPRARQ